MYTGIVKKHLSDSLKQLMRRATIDKITVDAICAQAGVNRRTFYRYFSDKYELAEWGLYNDYVRHAAQYTGCSLWDYLPAYFEMLYSDRAFYLNALRYIGQNSLRNVCLRYLTEVMRKDYAACFPNEEMYRFFAGHICGLAFDYIVLWLSQEPCRSPQQAAAEYKAMFYKMSTVNCALIARGPDGAAQHIGYDVKEPSKK